MLDEDYAFDGEVEVLEDPCDAVGVAAMIKFPSRSQSLELFSQQVGCATASLGNWPALPIIKASSFQALIEPWFEIDWMRYPE